MAVLAIELNDAGIQAAKDHEPGMETFPASPGIALWEGDALVTGREAYRRARLKPRWSHDRFWQQLDTTPLPSPFPSHLRRADLAHAHLEAIWTVTRADVEEVLLAVPGSLSPQQLGLALGIARSCRMPVSGVVDQAVAASVLAGEARDLVHLDLHLHHAVATKMQRRPGLVERTSVLVDEETGLARLFDAWAKFLAQVFVRTTRFDPLHRGETEQALYDRLPGWLDALRQKDSALLSMRGTDKSHSVEVTREQIVSAADPFLARIAELARSSQTAGAPIALLLTPAVADLPGLMDRLEDFEVDVIRLPAAAGAMGALKMRRAIRPPSPLENHPDAPNEEHEALPFVTRLPVDGDSDRKEPGRRRGRVPPSVEAVRRVVPTHVVCDGLAHPITSRPLVLGLKTPDGERGLDLGAFSDAMAGVSRSHCTIYQRDGEVLLEDHSTYGTFLNDKRVEGRAALAAGDRLRVGAPGIELRLIRVMDPSDGLP